MNNVLSKIIVLSLQKTSTTASPIFPRKWNRFFGGNRYMKQKRHGYTIFSDKELKARGGNMKCYECQCKVTQKLRKNED
jgi:predicted secreted Zn-dependent protease